MALRCINKLMQRGRAGNVMFNGALSTFAHFDRALSASDLSIDRSMPGAVMRCGNGSRSAIRPFCNSRPSGSIPTQRHSPSAAASSLVA